LYIYFLFLPVSGRDTADALIKKSLIDRERGERKFHHGFYTENYNIILRKGVLL